MGRYTGGILGALIGFILANNLLEINILSEPSLVLQILIIGACTIAGVLVLGPIMKYLFNSPEMHIWHHVEDMPEGFKYGINFGLTLAIWDYIFGTASIPKEGRDIKLGFPGVESFPKDFIHQNTHGFK